MSYPSCLNCTFNIIGDSNFCPKCGAPILKDRLSTKEVLAELFDVIFLWNKAFFKTVIALLLHPSRVCMFYINGGRNRYLNPLFFLLLCFLIYQLIIPFTNRELFIISNMKGAVDGYNSAHYGTEMDTSVLDKLNRYSKILFFLILPIIAFCSKLVFKSNRHNFAEHLSVNAYLLGQVILIGILISLILLLFHTNIKISENISIVLNVVFIGISQYQIFQNKVFSSILKSTIFMILCLVLIVIFNTILGIIIFSIIK